MYIPNINNHPAYLPYIFRLTSFRIAFYEKGKIKSVLGDHYYVSEEEWEGTSFDTLEKIKEYKKAVYKDYMTDLYVQGMIDGHWVDLRCLEILYELSNI